MIIKNNTEMTVILVYEYKSYYIYNTYILQFIIILRLPIHFNWISFIDSIYIVYNIF